MGLVFALSGVLGLFAPTADTTFTDTLHVFDSVDSVYSTEIIPVSYNQSQPIFSTGYFIPSHRTEKMLPSIDDVPQDDSLFFSDFASIMAGEEEMYPLSAVVKLFTAREDTAASRCSGLMVSPRHVLTAAHCIYFRDSLYSEVLAYAGYHNNGIKNPGLLSKAVKYYTTFDFHKEYVLSNDIALLELDSEIGYQSGWLGIGYINDPVSDLFKENLTYTYGYPAETSLVDSSIVYDGEEMIAGYGFARKSSLRSNKIQINTVGIPGQSGSSLFVEHEEYGFFSMGALSSTNLGLKALFFQALNAFTYLVFAEITDETTTTITDEKEIADAFKLHQNYPNPFNPTTTIPFELSRAQTINLVVYDATGKKVATLISDERKISGYHSVTFNARGLSSGIYLYVLQGEQFRQAKKLLLIK